MRLDVDQVRQRVGKSVSQDADWDMSAVVSKKALDVQTPTIFIKV
jgi:hypothetical protein